MGQGNARKFWDIGVADEPHLFALSSGVLTHNSKKNPMPESVTDRPTKAHEYLFLLSKSARYFYDAEAVREEAEYGRRDWSHGRSEYDMLGTERAAHSTTGGDPSAGRNRRSVWDIATEPFPEAHFATFPRKLVEPCILAGTSARGCCPCGAPWARVVEREPMEVKPGPSRDERSENGRLRTQVNGTMVKPPTSITTGWQPTCNCPPAEPIPAVVYDPFMGSGTVAEVAVRHRRDYLGSELNPDYIELAQQRINGTQVTLF